MTGPIRQATCVLLDGRALLIEGPPGSGKSSLALALIDRGATLVGDDGVTLEARGTSLWASPPPRTTGLLEIRNIGLVDLPAGEGPVALLLHLSPDAPRFVEQARQTRILGIAIPEIALWPQSPVLALRAQWALTRHGLAFTGAP